MYVSFSSLGLKKIKNNRFYIIWAIKILKKFTVPRKLMHHSVFLKAIHPTLNINDKENFITT